MNKAFEPGRDKPSPEPTRSPYPHGHSTDGSAPLRTDEARTPDVDGPPQRALVSGARSGMSSRSSFPAVAGYELLSELGRGTMGVVYKARQTALNRLVALKMIVAGGHATEEQRARFENEARAVAALQHPNIVQIHELGTSDGLPFLSLEFVDGMPLDARIDGMPQPPQAALALIEVLGRAIQVAHAHGIIHRDLKPANVLLAGDGTPKITDFGLAKDLESKSSQTRSGSQIGTPSYMAPEQAMCESYGHLVDVYALGAILYEMLVGRPPFLGASPYETTMLVVNQDPVRPSLLVSQVPADAETICLKCLQKDPSRRYAEAAALAEDCRRFLAGEPILSRPISPAERLWRWCRRNPRTSALAAAIVGLLAVVAVGSTAAAIRISKARNDAVEANRAADAAKSAAIDNALLADNRTGLALASYQTLVEAVRSLEETPGTTTLKRKLLEESLNGVNSLAENMGDSSSTETTALATHMLLGNLYSSLGKTTEAMDQYLTAQTIAWNRARDNPHNDAAQGNLAAVLSKLGTMRHELEHDMVACIDCYRQSLDIWRKLQAGPPGTEGPVEPEKIEANLAEGATNLGVILLNQGLIKESAPLIREGINARQKLLDRFPEEVALRSAQAVSYQGLGEACYLTGESQEAIRYFELSLSINEDLHAANRDDAMTQIALAEVLGNFGDLHLRMGKIGNARRDLKRSLALHRDVLALDGNDVDQARSVAYDLHRLGTVESMAGDEEESARRFDEARRMREEIVAIDPKNSERQIELMLTRSRCGDVEGALSIAASIRDSVQASTTDLLLALARCYAQCAVKLRPTDPAAADTQANDAVEAVRDAVAAGYRDRVTLTIDPDLLPLQSLPAYREIVAGIAAP
ncbi:MAG: Serine/threonine-protein kinase PknB [Planctomycetota bacterium]